MTQKDYNEALKIIDESLNGKKSMCLADRINYTKQLALLNLTKYECNSLYEYIDRSNTEFNIICFQCRDNCKKSERE
jgi:hypothetical protein